MDPFRLKLPTELLLDTTDFTSKENKHQQIQLLVFSHGLEGLSIELDLTTIKSFNNLYKLWKDQLLKQLSKAL